TCEDYHSNADPACDESLTLSCKELECDTSCVIRREHLESASNDPNADSDSEGVFFFIGAIGSGDSVIRSGEHRDQIAKQAKVIAFEMEGAGVWDEVPCIVIKGVCDYADSHKNKGWQNYAAATAASVAKAVMERYVASARVSDSSQSLNAGSTRNSTCRRVRLPPPEPRDTPLTFLERLETPPPPSATIPFSRDPDFVNRGDILDQIDQRCSEPAARVALVGLGGVGKSQLAIEQSGVDALEPRPVGGGRKLDVQVMETRKAKLGADHPDTLTSMANLASTLWKQGRWDEAEKLDMQVMETFKTKLGADHPDTLTSMANLASTYRNQGRWEEAEKLFVQVMETSKAKLGADHPDTLTSMANLAFTWNSQGRYEDALALMQDHIEAEA
ncbi:hypothetical protein N0V85_009748, partial [Neurospora sp. IMI 360204]